MAYNLTLLDRHGDAATVFVAPGIEPHASAHRVATNHRDTVPDDPEHASSLSSVERQDTLFTLLEQRPDPEAVIAAFLTEPLYTTEYARGFGTMYTAAYRPDLGFVDSGSPVAGEAVGVAARTVADHASWTGVAEIAGTSRQAAWERWRDR